MWEPSGCVILKAGLGEISLRGRAGVAGSAAPDHLEAGKERAAEETGQEARGGVTPGRCGGWSLGSQGKKGLQGGRSQVSEFRNTGGWQL